ncbi:hypothetical protein PUNSTDRAFT_141238 [Punctularia strigosozonata HHB-11173 SS5]|uniref:uncharacterized protein n=1 Tax=Punctularia strigosozonata (strain HHB-11173) TaxID=741275 RepID=UPI00044167FE|nr:uncharacterized protein PUNSTDRAFT_141238 [Punctularia strigosozonata HHB-11173 SS5]EIN12567.1 hypothetical protein PUNSTDRAFT_141238 [Punctularia strigosozonata HHB-11173 SS5]
MSSTSLPKYSVAPSFARTPSYRAEPQQDERRIAQATIPRARPATEFSKPSKSGSVTLRLHDQENGAEAPVYGCGAVIEGSIELAKPDNIVDVEIKIEGVLTLKDFGEQGTSSNCVLLDRQTLFSNPIDRCPTSLSFELTLPMTFSDGKDQYPLPPTYSVTLEGVPGFHASIAYSITAIATKAKSYIFNSPVTTVSTPITYYPRSRPAMPLPPPLHTYPDSHGFVDSPDWRPFSSVIKAKSASAQDIVASVYVPSSRIFCMTDPIPVYVTFSSSSYSLASFMSYGPTPTLLSATKQATSLRLVRQSTVDVRNELVLGTKTDIWRTDVIGEGQLQFNGDGRDFIAYAGQIVVNEDVKVCGFKAGGLFVKDYIVLTMTPPDPKQCPFRDLRLVIPVRLTTDIWDGMGDGLALGSLGYGSQGVWADNTSSVPSDPDDYAEALPQLAGMPRAI